MAMPPKEISESTIRQAAELLGPGNNFYTALQIAEDYRQAGLNPVYYMDDDERKIFVTTEEKMNGVKFH
jgi:hypothetical protein